MKLKCVAQTELQLTFGRVGATLSGNLAERWARRPVVGIVQVGMVEIVEGLCLEDQLMIFVAWNNVEALLQRRTGAVAHS